ncbi:MAG: hypothetical protein R2762_04150 [Bryobacteraceae bacterium]
MALACAGMLSAQNLAGPNSGFVYDPADKAIRLIVGVPGAAYLGGDLASGLDGASIAPDGARAVASRNGRLVLISTADGSAVDLGAWEGELALGAWSADGTAFAAKGSALALFRNLDATPEAVALGEFDGKITALAVAGRGTLIVATESGLFRLGEAAELLAPLEGVTALAMNAAGDRLYAASPLRKEIHQIGGLEASAEVAFLLGEAAGLDAPSALGVSGNTLYVADRGSHKLSAVRLDSSEMLFSLDLAFDATGMERLSSGRFLMTQAAGSGSIEIFDPARRAVLFVPQSGAFESQAADSVEE